MEENNVLETADVVKVDNDTNEIVDPSNHSQAFFDMALGAFLFATAVGVGKGLVYGVDKFKDWRAKKKATKKSKEETDIIDAEVVDDSQTESEEN